MKRTIVGLVLGAMSGLMMRDQPWPLAHSVDDAMERAIRHIKRNSGYRPTFNGRQPSVKRAHRQAKAQRARRRARRLGHA
jgi:hypothetical protein